MSFIYSVLTANEAYSRFNLDPFDAYDDADIWDALRRTQMAAPTGSTPRDSRAPSRVQSRAPSIRASDDLEEGGSETTVTEPDERFIVKSLEMPVLEGGKNFSAGESPESTPCRLQR